MSMREFRSLYLLLIALLGIALSSLHAEDISFPADFGVVDVTQEPYNADNTGATESTASIQKAVNDHHPMGRILYFPKGTYLVSDQIRWGNTRWNRGPMLQGESRSETVIRLQDNAPAFQNPKKPRGVFWTGDGSADNFINEIRNLTIETGSGNPGACGVQFMCNNNGGIFDVTIRSEDRLGVTGIDMAYTDMIGPLLIKNVRIEGFDFGIRCGKTINSMTFEHIELVGQKRVGLLNAGQCISVRDLVVKGASPAFLQLSGESFTVLDGGRFESDRGGEQAAVNIQAGNAYLRNIDASGHAKTLDDAARNHAQETGPVTEYATLPAFVLPDGAETMPPLTVKETPEVEWGDISKWANVMEFGADPRDDVDDTVAIQKAIDSGAKTVYFPYPFKPREQAYRIAGTVVVRGSVERLIGSHNTVIVIGQAETDKDLTPGFELGNGDSPALVIERLFFRDNFKTNARPLFQHKGKQPVVFRNLKNWCRYATYYQGFDKAGDVFFEDVAIGWPYTNKDSEYGPSLHFAKGQTVWARQLDPEMPKTKILNDGGSLWVLGLKTERSGTLIHTRNGGRTELLGGMAYSLAKEKNMPMFIVENSQACLSIGESSFRNKPFKVLLEARQGATTQHIGRDDVPHRGQGSVLPLCRVNATVAAEE